MCFFIMVEAPIEQEALLQRCAGRTPLRLNLPARPLLPWPRRHVVRATLSDGSGCACDLLADGNEEEEWLADQPGDPMSRLTRDATGRLAASLALLRAERVSLRAIECSWDSAQQSVETSFADLLERIASNGLENGTRYVLRD